MRFNLTKSFFYFVLFYPPLRMFFPDINMTQRILHLSAFSFALLIFYRNAKLKLTDSHKLIITPLVLLVIYELLYTLIYGIEGDPSDVIRPFFYFIYFFFGSVLRYTDCFFSKRELYFIIISQIFLSVLVHFPIGYFLVDAFKGRMSGEDFNFHFFRYSGSFVWPSDYSFFMLYIFFYVFLNRTILQSRKFLRSFLLFVIVMLIIFSGSRGGIIALLLGLLWYFRNRIYMIFIFLFFGAFLIFLTRDLIPNEYFEYLNIFMKPIDELDSSTIHRFSELHLAWQSALENFPFGVGPTRSIVFNQIDTVESFYGYYLWKWGFLGTFLMIMFYIFLVIRLNRVQRPEVISFKYVTVLFLIWFGFSSAITERYKVFPLYFITAGFLVSNYPNHIVKFNPKNTTE